MFRIPFSCAPVSTIIVTLQKAVTALVNVFQVIVVAQFLDKTIAGIKNQTFDKEIWVWFLIMVLMVSWKWVSYNIGRLFTNRTVIKGNEQVMNECTKKRSRVKYYLLEDQATEELMNRVMNKMERKRKIASTFSKSSYVR